LHRDKTLDQQETSRIHEDAMRFSLEKTPDLEADTRLQQGTALLHHDVTRCQEETSLDQQEKAPRQ
jgi:hypothetical protein